MYPTMLLRPLMKHLSLAMNVWSQPWRRKQSSILKTDLVEGCSLATFFFYLLVIQNISCRSKELLQKGAHNNSEAFKKGGSAFLLKPTNLDHATF